MNAIHVLRDEHALIVEALEVLEAMAGRVSRRISIAPDKLRELLSFFREYADRVHHAKEEQLLWPAMQAAGADAASQPIAGWLEEHVEERELLVDLGEAVEEGLFTDESRERFVMAAHELASMLRRHVHLEDDVLFPLAEKLLGPDGVARLTDRFDAHARAAAPGAREAWKRVIDALDHEVHTSNHAGGHPHAHR